MVQKNNDFGKQRGYFSVLWAAITGKDPLRDELGKLRSTPPRKDLEELRTEHERMGKELAELQDMYYKCLERSEKRADEVINLQELVEILRKRVSEKDEEIKEQARNYREVIERTKKSCQARIDGYNKEIADLREALQSPEGKKGRKNNKKDTKNESGESN